MRMRINHCECDSTSEELCEFCKHNEEFDFDPDSGMSASDYIAIRDKEYGGID